MSKTKYSICISARAKDAVDKWRQANNVGRFSYARLVHQNYFDNRQLGARRGNAFSIRIRPVLVNTMVTSEKLVEMLDLVNLLDIVAQTADGKILPEHRSDLSLMNNLLGQFLDAVIMGDLIDTNAMLDNYALQLSKDIGGRDLLAERGSKYNLNQGKVPDKVES